ncbi:MAG: fructose-bisphosphate aldolase class I, partial [Rhodospirillales bacterium]|nr:fructose-bisphosphate aldolase class I [Rhodospirillales bacterium]
GLDGLRERLAEYGKLGAKFAKWRAVIDISPSIPSRFAIEANAHALARYAGLCQEAGIVPIVEPEVLMDGDHDIDRCYDVTELTLKTLYAELYEARVALEGSILKPNMVIAGMECPHRASVHEVARATVRCLRRHVPAAVPGIVFLSGGQTDRMATAHLNEINRPPGPKPRRISFSYGRALQDAAMAAWQGRDENLKAGQQAIFHRARCNGAASLGKYTEEMKAGPVKAPGSEHRRD